MPDQLQLRGGTTTEHNSFTGALREVTVDTTKKTLVVHDGASAGGTALMKESGGNAASSVGIGTGGTNAININSSQQVGIGGTVTSSGYPLEILRSTADPFVNASDTVLRLNNTNTSSASNQTSLLFTTATSGVGSDSAIVSQSTSAGNTRLEFWTDTSNVLSKKMTLDASGRLLIGTTTEGHPSADNLTVRDTGNAGITIRSGTSNNGAIFFSDATSGDGEFDGFVQYNHGADPFMQFGVGGGTKMAIKGSNVGIGTTSPQTRLHLDMGAGGLPAIRLQHSSSGNDTFEITGGLTGVSNSGFGIRDVDENAYRFVINSSGNVGIGTTSPDVLFHVEGSGDTKATIETSANSNAGLRLRSSNCNMLIQAGQSVGDNLRIYNEGTTSELVRILSSGGITFNGDTATDNALDDYEEGTWTPSFQNISAPTYTSRAGKYTKIGRFVYLTGELFVASGLDTSDASAIAIGDLPFAPAATHNAALFEFGSDVSLVTQSGLEGFVNVNVTTGLVALLRGSTNLAYSQCNTSGNLKFALSYETAT